MPRMAWRVVFGCGDVIAILLPTRALIRVDFPVLGRPTIATNPERKLLMGLFSHYIEEVPKEPISIRKHRQQMSQVRLLVRQ